MHLMFLQLDGVRGESYAPRHIGEIELTALYWDTKHRVGNGGMGPGKASINDLTVFKHPDKTSLFLKVASNEGHVFKSAVLTVEKVSESGGLLHTMIVKLKSIVISFVSVSKGSAFEGTYDEQVEINFEDMKMSHFY